MNLELKLRRDLLLNPKSFLTWHLVLLSAFKQWSLCAWEKAKLNLKQTHSILALWLLTPLYSALLLAVELRVWREVGDY